MKTKLKLASILSMLFALLAFMPNTAKAQCPYKIKNTLNCQLEVKVQIYAPMPNCPLCTTVASLIVPPGSAITIPCNNCFNPCNIIVIVLKIDGVAVPAVPVDFSIVGAPGKVIRPVRCSSSGIAHIYYDPSNMSFAVTP